MEIQKKKSGDMVWDIVIVALSAALCGAPKTMFHVCGVKPDGSWMLCHWTSEAVMGVSVVLAVLAVIRFFCAPHVKLGINISMALLTGLTALLPGHLLPLCKMATMPCQVLFRPAVLLLSIFLLIVLVIDIIRQKRKDKVS